MREQTYSLMELRLVRLVETVEADYYLTLARGVAQVNAGFH